MIECLLDPRRGTRPFVKLVAYYDKVEQLLLGNISGAKIIGTLVALGTLAVLGGVDLAELWAAVGIFVQAMPVLGNALGAVLLVWLVWYAMGLTGQVSIRRGCLTLDLNGLSHSLAGPPHVRRWCPDGRGRLLLS